MRENIGIQIPFPVCNIIPINLHFFRFGLKNEIEQVRQHVSQFEVVCRETDHRTSAFANSHMTQRQLLELVLNASATGPDAENARKDQVRQFLDDLEGLTFDHKTSLSEVRYDLVTLTGCRDATFPTFLGFPTFW